MRILIVSQYFWPENFRINELAAELVARGHSVTVLTGQPNYPGGVLFEEYRKAPSHFMTYKGARIVRVPMITRGTWRIQLMLNYISFFVSASLYGIWKLRDEPFDAIFTCGLSPITVGIPSAVLRPLKKAPHILWVLDLWPGSVKAVGAIRSPWLLSCIGWVVKHIYKHCDLILAQSHSFITNIREYAGETKRVEYFPSWIEKVFCAGAGTEAVELKRVPGVFTILYAGNFGEAQDFASVLGAAEQLRDRKNIRWVFLGDGRMREWLRQQIADRKLGDCVQMLDRQPLERMPDFFASVDALLVSLKDEPILSLTIPGKLQSYLASGLPVLAMLNEEGARVVEHSKAGLVCPAGDFSGLAANALRLSEMPAAERAAMGQNGIRYSRAEFDRDALITKLEGWLSATRRV